MSNTVEGGENGQITTVVYVVLRLAKGSGAHRNHRGRLGFDWFYLSTPYQARDFAVLWLTLKTTIGGRVGLDDADWLVFCRRQRVCRDVLVGRKLELPGN